jgi:hypothetical protein
VATTCRQPARGWEIREQIAGAFAVIFKVVTQRLSRFHGQGLASFGDQLVRTFIETDHWKGRIMRLSVEIQHVLHAREEFGTDRWNAPFVSQPGLEIFF